MSWEKRAYPGYIVEYPGRLEAGYYLYTPGIHGLEFSKALLEGRILGGSCGGVIYVPPRTFCPDTFESEEKLVDVTNFEWIVVTYTIISRDLYGNKLQHPKIVAVVRPKGCEGGLIHIVKAEPGEIRTGLRVKPVFKPREQRKGVITDILHFEVAEHG